MKDALWRLGRGLQDIDEGHYRNAVLGSRYAFLKSSRPTSVEDAPKEGVDQPSRKRIEFAAALYAMTGFASLDAVIEKAKTDRSTAYLLLEFGQTRPDLFEARHLPGVIETARFSEAGFLLLGSLSHFRPDIFASKDVPAVIDAHLHHTWTENIFIDYSIMTELVQQRPEIFLAYPCRRDVWDTPAMTNLKGS